jgi:multicomponent Na+:H+ antiporter subunit D
VSALLIVLPLVLVLALNILPKKAVNASAVWFGLAFAAAQVAIAVYAPSASLEASSCTFASFLGLAEHQIPLGDLGRVMFLAIGIVGFAAFMVAKAMAVCSNLLFLMVNLLLLAMAGMNGIVVARDLFTLYVFLEVTSGASFVIIALDREKAAFEGAFKYVVMSAIATALMLASIAVLFFGTGSTDYATVASVFSQISADPSGRMVAMVALGMFLVGVMIKSGVMPFHGWLPDAYASAPAAGSVLLAGIVTKVTGVYTLIQLAINVLPYDGSNKVFLFFGLFSAIVGAFAALGQSDFKRMLSYSSISQVGYILLGVGAGSPLGYAGAIFHLFNHAIFKTLLFVNAATVEKQTGTRDMDKLGGLSSKMPVTGLTSVIAFLSTAGVPPLSGFWSKLIIIVAVWKAGYPVYAALAVMASLLTLAYFLSMQRRVFFGKLAAGYENVREGNMWFVVPAVLLALVTLLLGLGGPWLFETFLLPVTTIL